MKNQGAIGREMKASQDEGIAGAGREAIEINAIRNDLSRGMEAIFIEKIESGACRGGHILAAVTEMDEIRIGHAVKMFADKRIRSERTANIDWEIVISSDNRFTETASENLSDIAKDNRGVDMNNIGIAFADKIANGHKREERDA
jgi:hypothetical protein